MERRFSITTYRYQTSELNTYGTYSLQSTLRQREFSIFNEQFYLHLFFLYKDKLLSTVYNVSSSRRRWWLLVCQIKQDRLEIFKIIVMKFLDLDKFESFLYKFRTFMSFFSSSLSIYIMVCTPYAIVSFIGQFGPLVDDGQVRWLSSLMTLNIAIECRLVIYSVRGSNLYKRFTNSFS